MKSTMSTYSMFLLPLRGQMCPRHWDFLGSCLVGDRWPRGHWEAESSVKQHRGSVGVRWDGDVNDEDALVGDAALQRDGGGLHLQPHESRSVQSPQGEDDPPAGLVSNTKHPTHHSRLWFLLKYGERRAILQDAWHRESRQSHHIVIGWNARGHSEQLVLQEQSRAACGTVQRAGPVTCPVTKSTGKGKLSLPGQD